MTETVRTLRGASATELGRALRLTWPYHPRMLKVLKGNWAEALRLSPGLCLGSSEGAALVAVEGHTAHVSMGGAGSRDVWETVMAHLRDRIPRVQRLTILRPATLEPLTFPPCEGTTTTREETLHWERRPNRGPLHDPPERWQRMAVADYWEVRRQWGSQGAVWPRQELYLQSLASVLPLTAYRIGQGPERLAGAMLLWQPEPTFVHVLDLIWHPDHGVRSVGRYLLQELYMRSPQAHVVLDLERVSSPLNRVLAALGYRVYKRTMYQVWSCGEGQVGSLSG